MTQATHTASTSISRNATVEIGIAWPTRASRPSRAARAMSYVMGLLAGACELGGLSALSIAAKLKTKLSDAATARGRFCDGYDLVSDFAARKAYARAHAAAVARRDAFITEKKLRDAAMREVALRAVWASHGPDGSAR